MTRIGRMNADVQDRNQGTIPPAGVRLPPVDFGFLRNVIGNLPSVSLSADDVWGQMADDAQPKADIPRDGWHALTPTGG